jgi:hypothetical protein
MVGDLLDHGDNVHDAELDLCPDLHDAAVHRDELLRRHADQTEHSYLGMSFTRWVFSRIYKTLSVIFGRALKVLKGFLL